MTSARFSASVVIVVLLAAGAARASAEAPRYVATDLGDLPGGGDSSHGYGLNNRGQVVGMSRAAHPAVAGGLSQPFLWTPDVPNGTTGHMVQLPLLHDATYDSGSAGGINDSGQVTGVSYGANGPEVFLWTPATPNGTTGTVVGISPPPAPYGGRSGAAINNAGQVVGESPAFLWTPNVRNGPAGTTTELEGAPPAPVHGGGLAINASGQVTGVSDTTSGAFLWTPSSPNAPTGTMANLGTPPGYTVTQG
jgi:hypothetical protein